VALAEGKMQHFMLELVCGCWSWPHRPNFWPPLGRLSSSSGG